MLLPDGSEDSFTKGQLMNKCWIIVKYESFVVRAFTLEPEVLVLFYVHMAPNVRSRSKKKLSKIVLNESYFSMI